MRLVFIRNAGTVVGDFDADHISVLIHAHMDGGAGRGIFDRVVQQIYHNLHDQPGIHDDKEVLISAVKTDCMVRMGRDVPETLFDDIFHVFDSPLKVAAALQPGHGQDIFKLGVQPSGILQNIAVDFFPFFGKKVFIVDSRSW